MPRQEVPFSGDLLVVQRCAVSFFGVAKDASRPQGFAKILCRIFPAKLHVHNRGPLGADIAPPLPFFVPLCISVPCAIIHHSSFITHHSSSGASHKCPFWLSGVEDITGCGEGRVAHGWGGFGPPKTTAWPSTRSSTTSSLTPPSSLGLPHTLPVSCFGLMWEEASEGFWFGINSTFLLSGVVSPTSPTNQSFLPSPLGSISKAMKEHHVSGSRVLGARCFRGSAAHEVPKDSKTIFSQWFRPEVFGIFNQILWSVMKIQWLGNFPWKAFKAFWSVFFLYDVSLNLPTAFFPATSSFSNNCW